MGYLGNTRPFTITALGESYVGDSRRLMKKIKSESIDLICTSPPFALGKSKAYGNPSADDYVSWFSLFAREFRRILKDTGSLAIEIGSSWQRGRPVKNIYQYELLLNLCQSEENGGFGFHLAQELYWYNTARMPGPAEWVTKRRVRIKDSVTQIFWLSKTPNPKANNRNVLKEYGDSQKKLMEKGYNQGLRPSGHIVGPNWGKDNKGAIPDNIIVSGNTGTDKYIQYCKLFNQEIHPARFAPPVPNFIIKLCTDPGDLVLDPFAGSNYTGYVAEQLERKWISIEREKKYAKGADFRFGLFNKFTGKEIAAAIVSLGLSKYAQSTLLRKYNKLGLCEILKNHEYGESGQTKIL